QRTGLWYLADRPLKSVGSRDDAGVEHGEAAKLCDQLTNDVDSLLGDPIAPLKRVLEDPTGAGAHVFDHRARGRLCGRLEALTAQVAVYSFHPRHGVIEVAGRSHRGNVRAVSAQTFLEPAVLLLPLVAEPLTVVAQRSASSRTRGTT